MILGLFGCSWGYESDRETAMTRLVENDGACPSADEVLMERGIDPAEDGEAERTEWHRIDLPTLCYYRVSSTAPLTRCGAPRSLAALRAATKRSLVPDEKTGTARDAKAEVRCAEDGLVLVYPTLAESCPALTMDDTRDLAGVDCEPSYDLGELLRHGPAHALPLVQVRRDDRLDTPTVLVLGRERQSHGDVTTNARRSVSRPWRRPRPSRASRCRCGGASLCP